MSKLGPCIERSRLSAPERQFINERSAELQKEGLAENRADLQAAREFREQTLDDLHDVYHQLGVEGYENKTPQYASKISRDQEGLQKEGGLGQGVQNQSGQNLQRGAQGGTETGDTQLKVESAVVEINGKIYEGKNHAEALAKAVADGQDVSQIDRERDGKFKLSDGTIIDRKKAMEKFGADHSEQLIPQDEGAKQADKDYSSQKTEKNGKEKDGEKTQAQRQEGGGESLLKKQEGAESTKAAPSKKGILKKAASIEDLTDPVDVVMQHFAGGGRIHPSAIRELFGAKEGEKRSRIGLINNNAKTIDQLAHEFWENSSDEMKNRYDTQDYKEAIEQVLGQHNSVGSMAKELTDKYINQSVRQDLTEEENKAHSDKMIAAAIKEVEGYPPEIQQELLGILNKYQNQYGFIDWEKLEKDSAGFDPDILSLSNDAQKALYGTIEKHLTKGQGEHSNLPDKDEGQTQTPEPFKTHSDRAREKADAIRDIANKIRGFGREPGTLSADILAVPKEILAKAFDIVAGGIEAGGKIADLIDEAVKYIRANSDFKSKSEIDKFLRTKLAAVDPDVFFGGEDPPIGTGVPKVNPNELPLDGEPEVLKTGGTFKSRFVRGFERLASLEKALGTAQEALRKAYKAASSEGSGKSAIVTIARSMEKEFGSKRKADEVFQNLRKVLVQSNLNGLKQRWSDWSTQFHEAPVGEIEKWAISSKYAEEHGLPDLEFITKQMDTNEHLRGASEYANELVARNNFEGLRDFMSMAFNRASQLVTDLDWSEGKDYHALRNDPDVQKAKGIYMREFGSEVESTHKEMGGTLRNYLGEEGVYYPLTEVKEEEPPTQKKWFARRNALQKNRTPNEDFATGFAKNYDFSVQSMTDRIVSAYKARDRNAMIQEFKTQGYMVKYSPDYKEDVININGNYVPAVKVNINEGTSRRPVEYLIPSGVEKDIRSIMASPDEKMSTKDLRAAIKKTTDWVNRNTLSTPIEALRHTSNLLFRLNKNTPYAANNLFGKTVGAIPIIKQVIQLGELSFMNPSAERWQGALKELADAGEIPDKYGKYTSSQYWADMTGAERTKWWKGQFGAILYASNGIDIRARLMMWDIAKSMNPNATPNQLRAVMSTLGDYNKGLQSEIVSLLKEQTGVAPFIVSQQARIRSGVESITGIIPKYSSLPLEGLPTAQKAYYHTMNLLQSSVYGYIGMWAALFLAKTGKNPFTTKGSRLGVIPGINDDPKNPFSNISLGAFYTAASVGTKVTGMDAYFNTMNSGGTHSEAFEKGLLQSMNTTTAPVFSGSPVVHTALGLGGNVPYVVSLQPGKDKLLESTIPAPHAGLQLPFNALNDLVHVNPLVGAAVDYTMKKTMGYNLERAAMATSWKKAFYQNLLEGFFPGLFVKDIKEQQQEYFMKKEEADYQRGYKKEVYKQEHE